MGTLCHDTRVFHVDSISLRSSCAATRVEWNPTFEGAPVWVIHFSTSVNVFPARYSFVPLWICFEIPPSRPVLYDLLHVIDDTLYCFLRYMCAQDVPRSARLPCFASSLPFLLNTLFQADFFISLFSFFSYGIYPSIVIV